MDSHKNKYDEIDNMLFEYFNENKEIPKDTENLLKNIKYKKKRNYSMIRKVAIILISFSILTTGLVFANDIINWVYNIFNPISTSSGIIKLAESGYLYNTQMDYISSNNIKVKIDYVLMDDCNLDIVFNIKANENLQNDSIISLPDLLITDENNNILYSFDNITYEEFCRDQSLPKDNLFDKNYTNNGFSIELLEHTDEDFKFICKMYSTHYPKSEKLSVKFKTINITDSSNPDYNKNLTGNFEINLDLPEEFYNRETIIYKIQDDSNIDNRILIQEAMATKSEFNVSLKLNGEKINDIDSMFDSLLNNSNDINLTLVNENSVSYSPTTLKEGGFSVTYQENGDILVHAIFPITELELTDSMTLIINKGSSNFKILLYR